MSFSRILRQSRPALVASAFFLISTAPIAAQAPAEPTATFELAGDWLGALEIPGATLRLVFHFQQVDDGWTATLDSIDQGANGIPVSRVGFEDGKLVAEIKAVGGGYEGTVQKDGTIHGTWTQGASSLPLELARQDEPVVLNRPQEPQAPFPYRSEEVSIEHSDDDVTLAGTLTLPEGEGPFPAAILISGSGPQDRDESLLGHRPFLVLADHLTRHGLAVLRYDDRGTAESTGDFEAATSEDFADDTRAVVEHLRTRGDIGQIGLIGHSEGGLIAPMVAAGSDTVDFLVLLAGPGTTGREILLDQTELLYASRGMPADRLKKNRHLQARIFDHIQSNSDLQALKTVIGELVDFQSGGVLNDQDRQLQVDAQAEQLTSPWFRFFLSYDPVPVLAKVRQPVLALNGAKDFQVPPETNLKAIAAALESGGNPDFETAALDDLNHLFQTSNTGMIDEYAKIEQTFAPVALDRITDWILSKTQADSQRNQATD